MTYWWQFSGSRSGNSGDQVTTRDLSLTELHFFLPAAPIRLLILNIDG